MCRAALALTSLARARRGRFRRIFQKYEETFQRSGPKALLRSLAKWLADS
jgi:hypothetical protein